MIKEIPVEPKYEEVMAKTIVVKPEDYPCDYFTNVDSTPVKPTKILKGIKEVDNTTLVLKINEIIKVLNTNEQENKINSKPNEQTSSLEQMANDISEIKEMIKSNISSLISYPIL